MSFSQATVEALGWYVYSLTDPRTGSVFYVGKGSGQRAYQHAAEAWDRADHPELQKAKHDKILDIQRDDQTVLITILRHALPDADAAYDVESAVIDLLRHLHPGTLLNEVSGHHSGKYGLVEADEVEIRYAAKPMPDPGVPVIFTSLDQSWYKGIEPAELTDFTTRWWIVSRTLKHPPQYVLGVHKQIVRSVYRITGMEQRKEGDRGWEEDQPGRHRWGFVVAPAPELAHLIGTTARGLLGGNAQWSIHYPKPEEFQARDAGLAPPTEGEPM